MPNHKNNQFRRRRNVKYSLAHTREVHTEPPSAFVLDINPISFYKAITETSDSSQSIMECANMWKDETRDTRHWLSAQSILLPHPFAELEYDFRIKKIGAKGHSIDATISLTGNLNANFGRIISSTLKNNSPEGFYWKLASWHRGTGWLCACDEKLSEQGTRPFTVAVQYHRFLTETTLAPCSQYDISTGSRCGGKEITFATAENFQEVIKPIVWIAQTMVNTAVRMSDGNEYKSSRQPLEIRIPVQAF